MKLVLFISGNIPHHKNYLAIQRMCAKSSIEFEETRDYERLKINNYNILLSCHSYINYEDIPENIKIIYGPQFFIFPSGEIVGDRNTHLSNRCVYNVLSNWVKELYLEFVDDFIVPMKELPFSIDTDKFKPALDSDSKEIDCILYIKHRSNRLIKNTIDLLNIKNIKYKVFKYGNYNEQEYLDSLNRSKFMLTLDAHESQGFALEEALSTGVPLLVVDATTMYEETNDGINPIYAIFKPKKLCSTSVPYWSDECGIKITEPAELSDAIDKMMAHYKDFNPREYILRTLSDEVCMKRILDYFNLKNN